MLAQQDNARPYERERDFAVRFVTTRNVPPAPDAVFSGPDGAPRRLSDFEGRVVLVNLWASWCDPCLREMPALDRLQSRLGGSDFTVVAVSLDRDPNEARAFLRARGIRHLAFYRDDKLSLFQALNVPGLPLSVLIDRQGRGIGRLAGPAAWDGPAARKVIEEAIGKASTSTAAASP